jgi:hypothetical protein
MPKTSPRHCLYCPEPIPAGADLCTPHQIELEYLIMAAEPEPIRRQCHACNAEFKLTEARVIRSVKDPRAVVAGHVSPVTPWLCWVCARLHHSAQKPEVFHAF